MRRRFRDELVLMLLPLLLVFSGMNICVNVVSCWSNGGYSDNPSNPLYGTHDWIADHALDWLPNEEKQYILDNFATYLYGTELPDNGGAPDGIGDIGRHHIYYYANDSLQQNASAVRAQTEYYKAVDFFRGGNLVNASKTLGIMSHYIVDVTVFGHVMGAATDWGAETHHSDYENYVQERTSSNESEFNTYLVFDGNLTKFSAYDAACFLAYDTTFDLDGDLTCVWMDQNYNWSNPIFKDRCGESLNLAVNLLADVLHTFYLEVHEHFIEVPFHYQDVEYYCGPACLEMVFDFYGEDINQSEIADVARTIGEPVYSTYTDELRRAAHFSNISTSMGAETSENITGYTLRKLGYAAFEAHSMDLTQLKNFVEQDKPLILLMWYSSYHVSTHYRVVVGYNETHVFLHDPWNKPLWGGRYGGPNIAFNNTEFLDLWSYYGNWALYVSPWTINFSAPTFMKPGKPFQVNATIAYPQSLPNALSDYPASSCNATITLPANLSLAPGETQKKAVATGSLEAGSNATVSWMLTANSSMTGTIIVEAEGMVSGSVGPHVNYSAYDYRDRIGATANITIELNEDSNVPSISTPSRVPEGDVPPDQEVKVSVNVTDTESGVKNVTLSYTANNGVNWTDRPMILNLTTNLYEATISGQPPGTLVKFKIITYDNVENNATLDGTEPYCIYQVIPELPYIGILPLFIILSIVTVYFKKKISARQTNNKPKAIR